MLGGFVCLIGGKWLVPWFYFHNEVIELKYLKMTMGVYSQKAVRWSTEWFYEKMITSASNSEVEAQPYFHRKSS